MIVAPAHRENLRLNVDIVPGSEKFRAAARRIKRLQRPGIIYCATTTAVDEVGGALGRARIPVTRYHGKMRAADRDAAQREFMNPSRRLIMVATSAFGMGIDKPNIRYILHYQTPGSLEQYVQEIGRAGRDGHPAHCILLFDPADLEIQEHLQALSRPSVRHLERLEDALTAWMREQRAPSLRPLPSRREYRLGFARCWFPIFRRRASLSGIRKAASTSWHRPKTSKTACVISSRSSRPFAMRVNGVFDCFPTTRSRKSAGACSSGATLERTTHRVAERATAAVLTVLRTRLRARHERPATRPRLRPHQECMLPCVSPRRRPHGAWFGAKAPRRPAPRMRAPANDGSAHERRKQQGINFGTSRPVSVSVFTSAEGMAQTDFVAAFSLRLTMMRETSANEGCAWDARVFGSSSLRNSPCGQIVGMLSRKSARAVKRASPGRLSSNVPALTNSSFGRWHA